MDTQQTPLTTTWDSEADERSAAATVADRQETTHRRRLLYAVCVAATFGIIGVQKCVRLFHEV